MVLPLLLGMLGGALGPSLGIGALAASAIGSGLGGWAETGDIKKGLLTGLGSFAGGTLMGGLGGSASKAALSAPGMTTGVPLTVPSAAAGGVRSLLPSPEMLAPTGVQRFLGPGKMGATLQRGLDFAKSPVGIGSSVGGMAGSLLAGQGGDEGKGEGKGGGGGKGNANVEKMPIPRTQLTPPAGYRPGHDPEFNYGLSDVQSAADIRRYNEERVPAQGFSGGGIVHNLGAYRMAEGGLAALGGVGGAPINAPAPTSGGTEKDVITEAIRAIKGEISDPRPALGAFLAKFGEAALRDLVDKVHSGAIDQTAARGEGMVAGPGDGMQDRVPAKIAGGSDVLLSDGEFIVPADVVSGLGNGSSDAGAAHLDNMMDRVRKSRTGNTGQPKAVRAEKVMAA